MSGTEGDDRTPVVAIYEAEDIDREKILPLGGR